MNPAVAGLEPEETAMRAIVMAARDGALDDDDVAELARRLADSGSRLPSQASAADIASTGGIGSLSTLVCPLQLRVKGFLVPKLGVWGRPAGGVDVLQTIPGFNAALDPNEVRRALDAQGYVHLLAHGGWAPLDALLFAYRQQAAGQGLPALVIASLLAKKLAAGVVGAGLEVRMAPHGNFGADRSSATSNASRYIRVARSLDLVPACVITDASRPYQPYIGRGEALHALWMALTGEATPWLQEHMELCAWMVEALAARLTAPAGPRIGGLAEAHAAMLDAHGTTWVAFERRVCEVRDAPRVDVLAQSDGFARFDLDALRSILVARQCAEQGSDGLPADPAGVVLHVRGGDLVTQGTPLCSVRAPAGEDRLVDAIATCIVLDQQSPDPQAAPFEIEVT